MTDITTPMGKVTRDGDAVVLTYERALAHPREKVWRAITESEHLRQWFPVDIIGERAVGAPLRLTFWPEAIEQAGEEIEASGLDLEDATLTGEVLTWDPPHVFEFMWSTERLHFALTPTTEGTLLVATIRVTDPAPRGWQSNATGYHVCLDALAASLDGGATPGIDHEAIPELEQAYAQRG